jgi:hypothetical protein
VKYTAKSFTLPASGQRKDPCVHSWLDAKGRCVLCGVTIGLVERDWTKLEMERARLEGAPQGIITNVHADGGRCEHPLTDSDGSCSFCGASPQTVAASHRARNP